MLAPRQHDIGIAYADTHAVAHGFQRIALGLTVAGDGHYIEIHHDIIVEAVFVACRKVSKDAAADLLAFGVNDNRFDDVQRAVGIDGDVAVEAKDAFLGSGRSAKQEQQQRYGEPDTRGELRPGLQTGGNDHHLAVETDLRYLTVGRIVDLEELGRGEAEPAGHEVAWE